MNMFFLYQAGKKKEDDEPSRLTHFTSTQAKQENTIIEIEVVQPRCLSCLFSVSSEPRSRPAALSYHHLAQEWCSSSHRCDLEGQDSAC